MFSRTHKTSGAIAYLLSLPCESMPMFNILLLYNIHDTPSLPYENVLYCNISHIIKENIQPSLSYENMLYCNIIMYFGYREEPSLPCEYMLHCNLKWHYRLLINFNLFTNEESMILIHLYFRYCYQGP